MSPLPREMPERVGRFEIRRYVGEGGFGRVYEAYDPSLKCIVALKIAKPEQMTSPERVKRFQRGAGRGQPDAPEFRITRSWW